MSQQASYGGSPASRRSVLAVPFVLGALAIAPGWPSAAEVVGRDAGPPAQPAAAAPVFPLAVGPGQHYLVDARGEPFLIHGDTAWSLIADLTRENVDRYLKDRRARGFNTLLVNLIESRFATNAPANAYGELPFRSQPVETVAAIAERLPLTRHARSAATLAIDFSTPNDAYFAHADWVLRRAADEGFLVLLTPSYVGWEGGSQGWYRAMAANGPERLRQYGKYLGRRYRDSRTSSGFTPATTILRTGTW